MIMTEFAVPRFALLVVLVLTMARGSFSVAPKTEATRPFSTSERALFGYSYSEDCLFGSSSATLFGVPQAEREQKKESYGRTFPASTVKKEDLDKKSVPAAFIREI